MTIYEAAQRIANKGMTDKMVFKFFDRTNKDVIEYITLFAQFGIKQNDVWNQYERWQEI